MLVIQSCPTLATLWTVAHQTPLSMGFPRQEYGSGLPFPPPGNLPDPRIEPGSPALAGRIFTTVTPGNPNTLAIYERGIIIFIFSTHKTEMKTSSFDSKLDAAKLYAARYKSLWFANQVRSH